MQSESRTGLPRSDCGAGGGFPQRSQADEEPRSEQGNPCRVSGGRWTSESPPTGRRPERARRGGPASEVHPHADPPAPMVRDEIISVPHLGS